MTASQEFREPPHEGGIFLSTEEHKQVAHLVAQYPRLQHEGSLLRKTYPYLNLQLCLYALKEQTILSNRGELNNRYRPYYEFGKKWMEHMREASLVPRDLSTVVKRVSQTMQERLLWAGSEEEIPMFFDLAGKEYIALNHPTLKTSYLVTEDHDSRQIVCFTDAQLSWEHDGSSRYANIDDHITFLGACVLSVEV
ncbi:MAG TPA: hypothetical protein PKB09_04475 [Candidatus Saccharibacteria bacterium]|nr:hypothetical protein [Candidatus Saccharibacteria bacterium]